jgi:hypothetical protein
VVHQPQQPIQVAGRAMPAVAVHVDPAAQRRHALACQPRALLAMRARAGGKGNATAGSDNTVPGDAAARGQTGQNASDQSRPPWQTGAIRDEPSTC